MPPRLLTYYALGPHALFVSKAQRGYVHKLAKNNKVAAAISFLLLVKIDNCAQLILYMKENKDVDGYTNKHVYIDTPIHVYRFQ